MKLTRCGGYFFRRSVDFVDTNVRRGEIYYADLSPVVGSEQGGVRPVLIVQNDTGNRHSPTVIAAAITSQTGKAKLPTHIEVAAQCCGDEFLFVMCQYVEYVHLKLFVVQQ